jgi:hypothetical protein
MRKIKGVKKISGAGNEWLNSIVRNSEDKTIWLNESQMKIGILEPKKWAVVLLCKGAPYLNKYAT